MRQLTDSWPDVMGKSDEWHTAFYYLAEHVRALTDGEINHKVLYALVGTDGRYVNHANPLVRKRTAGALSRIIHSGRYVQDMVTRHTQDGTAFDQASSRVCAAIAAARGWDDARLRAYLENTCWPDVRRGLSNEHRAWRGDLDLFRVDQEVAVLSLAAKIGNTPSDTGAASMLSAQLHLVAFGRLDVTFARMLVDAVSAEVHAMPDVDALTPQGACLVRYASFQRSSISGSWVIPRDRPFTIGRYTDCDVIEAAGALSRLHSLIFFADGRWHFEDMDSRKGSRVVRGGETVFESTKGKRVAVDLEYGDEIVLANRVHYWFGELYERGDHETRLAI